MPITPHDLKRWSEQKFNEEPVHLGIPQNELHECLNCKNSFPAHKGSLTEDTFICDVCL